MRSLPLKLVIGLLALTACAVAAPAQAGDSVRCAGQRTAHPQRAAERQPTTQHRGYVVAVRMGWAA